MKSKDYRNLFEWRGDTPWFRGLPVQLRRISTGAGTVIMAGLKDAADLLDQPDFAERFIKDDIAPYGMELWPSSLILAEELLATDPGMGRTALDLGCGLGLVSIVAARCDWCVTASDLDDLSLRFASYNASLNDVDIEAFTNIDWHKPSSTTTFDRILAADVLYQRMDHVPILRCIEGLLSPGGTAWVCDPNRSIADGFADTAREYGFSVHVASRSIARPTEKLVAGRIFFLEPQKA